MSDNKIEAFMQFLDKNFSPTKQDSPSCEIHKAVDTEQRKAMFIVLEPTEVVGADLHGDEYSASEVEKACENFNRYCNQPNIQHLVDTENAEILESYISPATFELDSGEMVVKGSWVQSWYFPETPQGESLWKGVKEGLFTGLSIGCRAISEEI